MSSYAKTVLAIVTAMAIGIIVFVIQLDAGGRPTIPPERRALVSPATSGKTVAYQVIGEGFGMNPTVSGGFDIPLRIFLTDERGAAIGGWVYLRIKTATVGQALGSGLRQATSRASGPDWPIAVNSLRWIPPEGETQRASNRRMDIWVVRVPTPTPAGSQPTPPGARVVVWTR